MIDYGNLPPELKERVQGLFLGMFGGPHKLDCWLTRIADQLAALGNPAIRPIKLDASLVPAEFQSLMHRPGEVVDLILERLDHLSVFGYTVTIIRQGETFLARVVDQTSGHILEEVKSHELEGLARSMEEKYGPNVEVVKE